MAFRRWHVHPAPGDKLDQMRVGRCGMFFAVSIGFLVIKHDEEANWQSTTLMSLWSSILFLTSYVDSTPWLLYIGPNDPSYNHCWLLFYFTHINSFPYSYTNWKKQLLRPEFCEWASWLRSIQIAPLNWQTETFCGVKRLHFQIQITNRSTLGRYFKI
jgi:hypothetical protein